jgi:hypothetical protein
MSTIFAVSSCPKLTDTIALAGVLYIFATILCALSDFGMRFERVHNLMAINIEHLLM